MTYADTTTVEKLTQEKKPAHGDTTKYEGILELALTFADNEINSQLEEKGVPIPTLPEGTLEEEDPLNNLINAANLYAAKFIIDSYTEDENTSAKARSYGTMADNRVKSYINKYLTDNQESHTGIEIGIFTINSETYEE